MKRDIDFLKEYRAIGRAAENGSERRRQIIAAGAAVLAAVLIADIACLSAGFYMSRKAANLPPIEGGEEYELISALKPQYVELKAYNDAVETASEEISASAIFRRYAVDTVIGELMPNAEVESMTYSDGALNVNITASNSIDIPVFIDSLERSGDFRSVSYTGFSGGSVGGETTYRFTVSCVLKGGGDE